MHCAFEGGHEPFSEWFEVARVPPKGVEASDHGRSGIERAERNRLYMLFGHDLHRGYTDGNGGIRRHVTRATQQNGSPRRARI